MSIYCSDSSGLSSKLSKFNSNKLTSYKKKNFKTNKSIKKTNFKYNKNYNEKEFLSIYNINDNSFENFNAIQELDNSLLNIKDNKSEEFAEYLKSRGKNNIKNSVKPKNSLVINQVSNRKSVLNKSFTSNIKNNNINNPNVSTFEICKDDLPLTTNNKNIISKSKKNNNKIHYTLIDKDKDEDENVSDHLSVVDSDNNFLNLRIRKIEDLKNTNIEDCNYRTGNDYEPLDINSIIIDRISYEDNFENNKEVYFNLYNEKDIAIGVKWQHPLRIRTSDMDDLDSDDSLIEDFVEKTNSDVLEAVKIFKEVINKKTKEKHAIFPKRHRIKLI